MEERREGHLEEGTLTFGMKPRIILPSAADRTDMSTRLAKAPAKTTVRECREAMIAAIRKVLSPGVVSGRVRGAERMGLTDLRHDDHEEGRGERIYEDISAAQWMITPLTHGSCSRRPHQPLRLAGTFLAVRIVVVVVVVAKETWSVGR